MLHKLIIKYISIFLFLFLSKIGYSQKDTSILNINKKFENFEENINNEFDKFLQTHEQEFDKFLEKSDKIFIDFLQKSWDEFELFEPNIVRKPKPHKTPLYREKIVKKTSVPIKINIEKSSEKEPKLKHISIKEIKEKPKEITKSSRFLFYGVEISIDYDVAFLIEPLAETNPITISNYWRLLALSNYEMFIATLLEYKIKLELNDWGYYLLVKSAVESIYNDSNNAILLTWFILNKSGYNSKIGFNSNQVYTLLPSKNNVYNKRYYTFNNVKYYVLKSDISRLYIYKENYPEAKNIIDFRIFNAMKLGTESKQKVFNFRFKSTVKKLKLDYSRFLVEYYKEHPQVDFYIYFNAPVSEVFKKVFESNFLPLLDKSEHESVSLLLNFTQTAFNYKTDKQQFKTEKPLFPDETLHYPYSDCEDRSILFTSLVRNLLELDVIGLDYPNHVAVGVCFNGDVDGDYVIYKGKKYIVCDPTYINAPIGKSMPEYQNIKANIIEVN